MKIQRTDIANSLGYSGAHCTVGCADLDRLEARVVNLEAKIAYAEKTLEHERGAVVAMRKMEAAQMTEEKAAGILSLFLDEIGHMDYVSNNRQVGWPLIINGVYVTSACFLAGVFEPEQLEAMAWWGRNKEVAK